MVTKERDVEVDDNIRPPCDQEIGVLCTRRALKNKPQIADDQMKSCARRKQIKLWQHTFSEIDSQSVMIKKQRMYKRLGH